MNIHHSEQNFYPKKAYVFSDFKTGLKVWDNKPEFEEFRVFTIIKILSENECEYLYHDRTKKVFIDDMTGHAREFEGGRYFPLIDINIKKDK